MVVVVVVAVVVGAVGGVVVDVIITTIVVQDIEERKIDRPNPKMYFEIKIYKLQKSLTLL